MLTSKCDALNSVSFPKFMGERHYMIKFFKESGLPDYLSRFQSSVDQMLENIDTSVNGDSQPIFITIDEGIVKKGDSHRRGGAHIDGYWNEDLHCWGNSGGWGSKPSGGWGTSGWKFKDNFITPESIVLASSHAASRGWVGKYENNIGDGGDLTHLDLSNMDSFILNQNTVYRGNVTFIHESIPVECDIERTLIRLNIKNC